MPYLLNVVYLLLVAAISPYLLWRSLRTRRYRRGWRQKLFGAAPSPAGTGRPVIWLHAVSVGEVNLLEPLVRRLRDRLPACRCVISVTTDTGYDLAVGKYAGLDVFYCPLDFSWAVRRALRRVQPDLLVLAELELWPNLIAAADQAGVPVAVVNGRLSERSFRGYRRLGGVVARMVRRLSGIAAQTREYADRFRTLGADPRVVTVTGSVKFDGAETRRDNDRTVELTKLAGYVADQQVLLAGSTQAPEEALAVDAFAALRASHPDLRLILVPRHPERSGEVAALLQRRGLDFVRRSELTEPRTDSPGVLLVDVVGELGAWWGRADVAYVGGSMGSRGGQNMIEPAAYGAAVSFGPRTSNFRDVVELLTAADAATVVADGAALLAFVRRCLDDPGWAAARGARARALVQQQQGAADQTVDQLLRLMPLVRTQSAA